MMHCEQGTTKLMMNTAEFMLLKRTVLKKYYRFILSFFRYVFIDYIVFQSRTHVSLL